MTVIAWDGTTLAADKMANYGGTRFTVTKVHRIGDYLVGVSGAFAHAGAYLSWFAEGRNPAAFPKQATDDGGYLLAVHRSGRLERFEGTPWPVVIEENRFACGSGRDFAIAALHCGRSAKEAVELACRCSTECGNGVDTVTFEDAP